MLRARIFGACVLILATGSGIAQEHQHAAGEKLGTVHLTTSCTPAAQKQFDRAVALLHSFQFSHAIDGFNTALKADSSCAMAYWGIALSHWSNPFATGLKATSQLQDGRQAAEQGWAIGARTERERAYIAAVSKLYADFEKTPQQVRLSAYRDAMAEMAAHYPQDHEASIFYALALAASEEPTDKTYASRLKAGAILEGLFAQEPEHPGLAHYIIHTYDVPPLAARALLAAQRYSTIAPDAPHALHMPSHTFTRVGYWQDSIDSNLAASAAARREGQTAEELHALDYQTYAYLQTAQDEAARRLVESLPEIAVAFRPQDGDQRRRATFRRILCTGGHSGALCARAAGLEGGSTARGARDLVPLHRGNDILRPRSRCGASGRYCECASFARGAHKDPRTAYEIE